MATSWTQADLAKLEKAIASGALKVKYQDHEVTYRSLAEMMTARETIRRSLGVTYRSSRTQGVVCM